MKTIMKAIAAAAVMVCGATAQDAAPSPAPETAAPAATPAVCPIQDGTFNELNAIGVLLVAQGNAAQGEACLSLAIASTVSTFRQLSNLATARSDVVRAAMISNIARQLDGTAASNYFHAQKLLIGGDAAGSLQILNNLAESDENGKLAEFNHIRGIAQFQTGQTKEAEESISKALSINPASKQYADDLAAVQEAIKTSAAEGEKKE